MKEELAKRIYDASYIKGDFTLRSGQTSSTYVDKYRFESDPQLLRDISHQLVSLLPPGVEVLAGLELGGVPLATAMALETSLPVIFVRKVAKSYGTKRIAEGVDFVGKRICIVEDVVTTGGQVVASAEALRKEGGLVEWVTYVVDRGDTREPLNSAGLISMPLFHIHEVERAGKA